MKTHSIFHPSISEGMKKEAPDKDIVLSSRIRLARNIKSIPFVYQSSHNQLEDVVAIIEEVISNSSKHIFQLFKMKEMDSLQRHILVEKHLISPNLEKNLETGAILISEDQHISLMINEEDHLRIQCIYPGYQLEKAYMVANEIDDTLEMKVDYSFSEKVGYLTSCPSNVGTGLRASVMVHLPALVLTRKIDRIISMIHKFGMVVRGIYGEGSQSIGNVFQISNQITLGKSEKEIISDIQHIVQQVIAYERKTRAELIEQAQLQLEDKIFRSLGTLENCRIISSAECFRCLSDVQLGIDLGLIKHLTKETLNELIMITQPALLQQYAEEKLSPNERDSRRALVVREKIKNKEMGR